MNTVTPVAVILRGPPCGGKTTVAKRLLECFGDDASLAILDRFWMPGEKRYLGICRYWDLFDESPVLIVELGYGEPHGDAFHGATRNPREWLTLLEASGRRPLFFLIWAPWEETRTRLLKRRITNPDAGRGDHRRYDEGEVCSSSQFIARVGTAYTETRIETKEATFDVMCDGIVAQVRGVLKSG